MFSLEDFKARVFQLINNRHSYERFVLDNKNGDTLIHFHAFLLETDPVFKRQIRLGGPLMDNTPDSHSIHSYGLIQPIDEFYTCVTDALVPGFASA
jgi:hypothetical protein